MKISVFYEHICDAAKQSGKDVSEIMRQAANAGIEAADVDVWRLDENPNLLKLLSESGLKIASVYGFFDFGNTFDDEKMKAFIDKAEGAGAEKVLCIPGFFPDDCSESDKRNILVKMTESLQKMCAYAETKGVTVTLEDFDSEKSPVATADGMLYFAERIPEIRFTFDSGNFMFTGGDELIALERLKSKIVHVHLKDRSLTDTGGEVCAAVNGQKMYPCFVGGGCIRIAECVSRIVETGYDGYFAIEHFGAKNQLDTIMKSAEFIKELNK